MGASPDRSLCLYWRCGSAHTASWCNAARGGAKTDAVMGSKPAWCGARWAHGRSLFPAARRVYGNEWHRRVADRGVTSNAHKLLGGNLRHARRAATYFSALDAGGIV